jgi:hypothetical protein
MHDFGWTFKAATEIRIEEDKRILMTLGIPENDITPDWHVEGKCLRCLQTAYFDDESECPMEVIEYVHNR